MRKKSGGPNAGILGIDRLGLAVRDLSASRAFFERTFGARFGPEHDVPGQNFHYAPFTMGGFTFELLAPKPGAGPSVISRFIEKRGEGIHHLTFQVRDLDAAIAALGGKGYAIAARITYPPDCLFEGVHWEEAFLHPKDASGVLVHLAQKTKVQRKIRSQESGVRRKKKAS